MTSFPAILLLCQCFLHTINSQVQFISTQRNWDTANADCQSQQPRAHLLTATSTNSINKQACIDASTTNSVWIGLNRIQDGSTWEWISGVTYNSAEVSWANNNPQTGTTTMSYHRVPRAAALKAQQRVKDIQDEKNSIRRIHQGEIRLSEYAYVNPDADPLIGDNNKGAVLIASPPMLDSNNDYGIDCIFANDHSITICIIHAHNSPTSTIPSNISQYYPSDTKDAPTPAPISTPENIPENAPIPTPQPKTPFISIPTPTVIPSGYSLYGAIGSGDSLYGSGDSFYTLQKLKIGSEISLYGSGDSLCGAIGSGYSLYGAIGSSDSLYGAIGSGDSLLPSGSLCVVSYVVLMIHMNVWTYCTLSPRSAAFILTICLFYAYSDCLCHLFIYLVYDFQNV